MSYYKVDGQPLPIPDGPVNIHYSDLDAAAAGRDEAGFLHRIRVRRGVRTWDFTYKVMTEARLQALLTQLSPATFRFGAGEETVTAYCAKQEAGHYDCLRGIYKDVKFTVVEC